MTKDIHVYCTCMHCIAGLLTNSLKTEMLEIIMDIVMV